MELGRSIGAKKPTWSVTFPTEAHASSSTERIPLRGSSTRSQMICKESHPCTQFRSNPSLRYRLTIPCHPTEYLTLHPSSHLYWFCLTSRLLSLLLALLLHILISQMKESCVAYLVVEIFDFWPLDTLSFVFLLLLFQDQFDEQLLQFLVTVVDAKLFEAETIINNTFAEYAMNSTSARCRGISLFYIDDTKLLGWSENVGFCYYTVFITG